MMRSRLHFIHLGNETELCVPVSCLKDRHRSLLVSVPLERSGVTDVGKRAMDQVVTKDEQTEKVSSEDGTKRLKGKEPDCALLQCLHIYVGASMCVTS